MNSNEKFSEELDRLLKSDQIYEDSEFYDDLVFAKKIKNLQGPQEDIKKEVLNNMKNNKSKRPLKIVAVAACLIVALPFTSAGQELYTVIKEAVLPSGRIQVIEEKANFDSSKEVGVPEAYKGHVFDKDGNPVEKMGPTTRLYNKDGEEIVSITDDGNGNYSFYTREEAEKEDEKYSFYDDQEKIAEEKLNFKPLLLPEKYEYQKSMVYSESGEKTDYANFFYKDKKDREIILFERVSSQEAGYATGGENIKEINIDGTDVIFHDNDSFEFERDGLLVTLLCRDMSYDEMLEVYRDMYLYK
jgi:hypothetical protein